jgi:Methyltransferase domain
VSRSPLRRLARRLARPVTRPLDGRVADVNRRIDDVGRRLDELVGNTSANTATLTESNAYLSGELRRFADEVGDLSTHIDEHEERLGARLEAVGYASRLDRASRAPLSELDGAVANLVNYATGHHGFAAQAGLWFNPPMTVELGEASAKLGAINERIVELPFALGELARLPRSARILDVGSAESTFALSAASLGYTVTAIDLRPLAYEHPNITAVVGRFEDWDPGSARFDAVFLISTIEHFGLGAYGERVGEQGADRAALQHAGELLSDEGLLVLTTPFGAPSVDSVQRTYDRTALSRLLDGWRVLDERFVLRQDDHTWVTSEPNAEDDHGVAMIVATPVGVPTSTTRPGGGARGQATSASPT